MNDIVNDGLINDDYILPCTFTVIGDDEESVGTNSLRAHLDLNLHSVTRDETFNFNNEYSSSEHQMCSDEVTNGGNIEDSLLSSPRDLINDVYNNFESSGNCSSLGHNESANHHLVTRSSDRSITKTLRGIKRVPQSQQNFSNPDDNLTFISDSMYNTPSYDILSCTVLIDASSKRSEDVGNVEKIPLDQEDSNKSKEEYSEKRINNDRMYHCSDCDKQFRVKSHLVSHSRAHREERKFKCPKCDLSFKTEVNLRFHVESHTQTPLKCTHCDKVFIARRILSRHIRIVHSQENFECEQCGKKFKTHKNLIHHYGIHSGIRPFACHICSKTFLHSSSLNIHLREHESKKDCIQCSLAENKCSENVAQCSCGSLCTGSCSRNDSIIPCSHVSRPFLCTTCGKPFKLKSSLVTHMKTHEPTKQYKCDSCNKVFLKRVSYEIHMKRHRGERPEFMCDQCCQSYYTQFSLRRHYRKHTTQPSFTCSICNKNFWMKDALSVHLRSHTKEKNFRCSLCDKSFSHKSTLVAHTKSLHPQSSLSLILQPIRSSTELVLNSSR